MSDNNKDNDIISIYGNSSSAVGAVGATVTKLDDLWTYTYSGAGGGGGSTFSLGSIDLNTNGTYSIYNPYNNGITVEESADIKLGEKSLKEFMTKVEERLALLESNYGLEEEWEELRQLGNQYRAKESEIKDQLKTLDLLKQDYDIDKTQR